MEKLLDKIQAKILVLKRKKLANIAVYSKAVNERFYGNITVKTFTIELKIKE